jgi:hypothetical protein
MSCHFRLFARSAGPVSTMILPLCLFLSACGGGDGGTIGIAVIPPPPATPATPVPPAPGLPAGTVIVPPAPLFAAAPGSTIDVQRSWLDSPATRLGTSGLIGRLTIDPGTGNPWTFRPATAGEFTMTVTNGVAGGFNYALTAPAGLLPAGLTKLEVQSPSVSWDLNLPPSSSFRYLDGYGDDRQYFGQRLTAFAKAPDGSEKQFLSFDLTRAIAGSKPLVGDNYQLQATLTYDVGDSYVAMGEWSWPVLLNGNPTNATNFGRLLFVNGDRTPASGIPASGTATYDARSLEMLSSAGTRGIPFTLTADFGLRTIATRIDQDFANFGTGPDDSPIQGIHIGGNAPFSNDGSFDIPLIGTVNYSYQNQATPPPSEAATGDMNGAFFGPNAQQIGGTFSIQRSTDQLPLYQDAFVGQQHHR